MKSSHAAIIGAGISGLTCARTLAQHGWRVTVFEKSRGVGGRMAVRRTDSGLTFDHGAQYFTVHDDRFAETVAEWQRQGVAARWQGRIANISNGKIEPKREDTPRFIGVPGMNAVCKQLAEGLEVRCQTKVSPPRREGDSWNLIDDQGSLLGRFDHVVISTPSPQAAELLVEAPQLAQRTRDVKMQPCWTILLAVEQPVAAAFDGAFVHESPLSWICRNSSKPERSTNQETWVLQATADWSTEHESCDSDFALQQLLAAFWRALGQSPQPLCFATAHRWRYARADQSLTVGCLFDPELRLGVCGDWCCGSRVEGAFLSGLQLAERLLEN